MDLSQWIAALVGPLGMAIAAISAFARQRADLAQLRADNERLHRDLEQLSERVSELLRWMERELGRREATLRPAAPLRPDTSYSKHR